MSGRRIAAATLVLGLGGAALAGTGLVLAVPATASAASLPAAARPAASNSAGADPSPSSSNAAPVLPVPTTAATAQPTASASDTAPTDQPTAVATTAAPPTEVATPSAAPSSLAPTKARATATSTARSTSTAKPSATRSVTVYRTYAPSTAQAYTGTTETGDPYPYTGAADSLPSGAAATGVPLTKGTVKPATSADPVYVQATSAATTTARKYIDVNGVSVDGVLGDAAIAGGILGLLGGAGLWFTRGAR